MTHLHTALLHFCNVSPPFAGVNDFVRCNRMRCTAVS
jgi:hypothetical protein